MRVRTLLKSMALCLALAALSGCGCNGGPAPPSDVPENVDGATLTIGESTVNGLHMKAISCKTDGGLLTPLTLQAGLAKQKDALDACVAEAAAVRVAFEYDGGSPSGIAVADAPNARSATCVRDALAGAKLVGRGKCVMTLDLAGTP